ncbi:heat shock 70 kDa protein-like [Salvia hispanica]|uniref:heat shock 70 kDa protein-like n=1 Tax=Salvia hispanica TaxID=49212 RepID=UPI0020098DB8|nr:heat shock 70 kDa protein-like [Salvia hispanica]
MAYGVDALAAKLSGEGNGKVQNLVLSDVTSLSLGIETHGGLMACIISRNTPIPTRRMKCGFWTGCNFQTGVTIKVYEGERSHASENNLLGVLYAKGIPPLPRSVEIMYTFDIDENGIMTVLAEVKGTRVMNNITITVTITITN